MSITFGTTYKSGYITANPSATFAITVPAGAQMYVGVLSELWWGTAKTVSGITANGIALAKLEGLSGYAPRRFELWHLKAPDTGAQNLVVTLTGPTDVDHRVGVIVRFPIGADPTAPVRDSAIVDDMGIDYAGPAVTSAVGDTVVDFGYSRTEVASFVADAGQTDPQTVGDSSLVIFSSLKAGASPTVTTGWEDQASGSPGYDGVIAAVSLIPGSASATITLTDPVSVVTGSTAACTITRSTAASGTITYNLTSSATGVATVPATATIADGQTTGTFNVTGVSAGSATITATNAADSGETDTATANVSALKGLSVTFGQTGLTGLTFAWFDQASPDLFAAPTVVGTTESTDGSGVLEINLTGTSVAVGNTGYLLIYKAGATAPDDIAFFGRMTVQDIG